MNMPTTDKWSDVMGNTIDSYASLIDIIRRRRSVRRFEPVRRLIAACC